MKLLVSTTAIAAVLMSNALTAVVYAHCQDKSDKSTKSQTLGSKLFHSKRKLASKPEASDTGNQDSSVAPLNLAPLDFGTDSFVIN